MSISNFLFLKDKTLVLILNRNTVILLAGHSSRNKFVFAFKLNFLPLNFEALITLPPFLVHLPNLSPQPNTIN